MFINSKRFLRRISITQTPEGDLKWNFESERAVNPVIDPLGVSPPAPNEAAATKALKLELLCLHNWESLQMGT